MIETAEDRLVMLSDFGVTATYTHEGNASEIKGIFDNEYEAVDVGGSVPFAMEQPRFYCRTSDVPNVIDGDTLQINSVTYIVRVIMPDGTGITELQLEKQ
jgi:hypothetical protein